MLEVHVHWKSLDRTVHILDQEVSTPETAGDMEER